MNRLIEDALVDLHKLLHNEVGIMNGNQWLFKIQEPLIHLQENKVGMLEKRKKFETQTNYVTIKLWLKKLNIDSIEEGIAKEKDIISHILGLRHNLKDGFLHEKDCNIVDCIVLGVIPKDLNNCILENFRESTKHINNNHIRRDVMNSMKNKWHSIIKLIKLQVLGIHKICSDIAKDFKKEWMNKFNITSVKKARIHRNKLIDLELMEEESTHNMKTNESCRECICTNAGDQSMKRKLCNGIKCAYTKQIWASERNIGKRRIKMNEKTCQNCAKLHTALKKAIKIGEWLVKEDKHIKEDCIHRNKFLKNMCESSKLYLLGNILEQYIKGSLGEDLVQLKGKNGRITDSTRLILRMLGQVLGFQTLHIFNDDFVKVKVKENEPGILGKTCWTIGAWKNLEENLSKWKDLLVYKIPSENIIKTKRVRTPDLDLLEISKDTKRFKAEILTKEVEKYSFDIPQIAHLKRTRHNNTIGETSNNACKRLKKLHRSNGCQRALEQITSTGELLSSDYAELVLDAIRNNCGEHTYIAGAYASSILALETNNSAWRPFGRLFRNNRARNKENGIYILPTFTGNSKAGHWLVNAVWWKENEGTGFTLDSLECGGTEKATIRKRIEDSFGCNNMIEWNEIQCVRQVELECGPRMLWAIENISAEVNSLVEFEALILEAANLFNLREGGRGSINDLVRRKVGNYLNCNT